MNFSDIIIGLVVFGILMGTMFIGVGNNITNGEKITKFNQINELQQKIINDLNEKVNIIDLDKQKEGFQKDMKDVYINSFSGHSLNIENSSVINHGYTCYNIFYNSGVINLGDKVSDLNIDINETKLLLTGYNGEKGVDFLNIACFYNTLDYLKSSNPINNSNGPIGYLLYTFYEDNYFEKQLVSNKGIIYFN